MFEVFFPFQTSRHQMNQNRRKTLAAPKQHWQWLQLTLSGIHNKADLEEKKHLKYIYPCVTDFIFYRQVIKVTLLQNLCLNKSTLVSHTAQTRTCDVILYSLLIGVAVVDRTFALSY